MKRMATLFALGIFLPLVAAGCTSEKATVSSTAVASTTTVGGSTTSSGATITSTVPAGAATDKFCIAWKAASDFQKSEVDVTTGRGPKDFDTFKATLTTKLDAMVTAAPTEFQSGLKQIHKIALLELDIIKKHNYRRVDVLNDPEYRRVSTNISPQVKRAEKDIGAYQKTTCGA